MARYYLSYSLLHEAYFHLSSLTLLLLFLLRPLQTLEEAEERKVRYFIALIPASVSLTKTLAPTGKLHSVVR